MIVIDMRMPLHCRDCPGSYYIMPGPLEGYLMCNIQEFMGKPVAECLLEPEEPVRPSNCPLIEVRKGRSCHGKENAGAHRPQNSD